LRTAAFGNLPWMLAFAGTKTNGMWPRDHFTDEHSRLCNSQDRTELAGLCRTLFTPSKKLVFGLVFGAGGASKERRYLPPSHATNAIQYGAERLLASLELCRTIGL
jgi:hypothetical protein